jgi:hypothetical protein
VTSELISNSSSYSNGSRDRIDNVGVLSILFALFMNAQLFCSKKIA